MLPTTNTDTQANKFLKRVNPLVKIEITGDVYNDIMVSGILARSGRAQRLGSNLCQRLPTVPLYILRDTFF